MNFALGVCHPLSYTADGGVLEEPADLLARRLQLIRAAGIEWVACDIPFPFEGELGRVSAPMKSFLRQVETWHEAGLKVLGVTPYPAGFEEGWKIDAGPPGINRWFTTR